LQQALVVKVLEERLVLRVVVIDDLFEFFRILCKFLPLLHSSLEFILNWCSFVVVLLVEHYTVSTEKLLLLVLASFNIADKELDVSSSTVAYHVVGCCPIV
jgi:hypothetical protein